MGIQTEKELGKAINEERDTIEIEGDLCKKVLRIKATGNAAWAIAMASIVVAVGGLMYAIPEPTTQALSKAGVAAAAGGSVAILGVSATVSAISISIAAGSVGALNKLRAYTIIDKSNGKLILKRK